MARTAPKRVRDEEIRARMDHLARFISRMEPEEIWGLLDSLFSGLPEEEKEDLYGLVIAKQRESETAGRPAADVFAEMERERGLTP